MKKAALFLFLSFVVSLAFSQNLKPYILAYENSESMNITKEMIARSLERNSLKVLGQYMPANDKNRWVIVFTSLELQKSVEMFGGLTGFASALRVAITIENGKTRVSYTNPAYWGNAYFRDNFDAVSSKFRVLNRKIEAAMKDCCAYLGTPFGSEKGLEVKELRKYHYMMGMPYFDDTEELEDFDSYSEAVSKIESNIKKGVPNVKLVYRITFPDKELALYGFALSGEDGEEKFMPIIDIGSPKHTAFLPYEILVKRNEVHMLHGRFRIALSFPDLTMGTFSKIMSTPGNIEDLMEQMVE